MKWFGSNKRVAYSEEHAKFIPETDITAYELAIIVANLTRSNTGTVFLKDDWINLDSSIKRHFKQ